jgi:hypothetical protein
MCCAHIQEMVQKHNHPAPIDIDEARKTFVPSILMMNGEMNAAKSGTIRAKLRLQLEEI